MPSPLAASFKALGASTSGTGTTLDLLSDSAGAGPVRKALKLELDLRALTAGASIKVELETSPDSASWTLLKALGTFVEPAIAEVIAGGAQRYVRAKWTITGSSPSVTWSLTGQAHVVYCEPSDVKSGVIAPQALKACSEDDLWRFCVAASDDADGYIGGAYALPLLRWGGDLRGKVGELVVSKALRFRGCDPEGADKIVFDTEATALKWFNRLADGKLSPPGIVDSTGDEIFEGGSVVVSSGSSRGW